MAYKRYVGRALAWACVVAVGLALSGCAGPSLPAELVSQAKEIPNSVQTSLKSVEQNESRFTQLKSSSDYTGFLAPYAERENWENEFTTARSELNEIADKLYKADIEPLLKENKPEGADALKTHIDRFNKRIKDATERSRKPSVRAQALLDARKDAPALVDRARSDGTKLKRVVDTAKDTVVKAQADYPVKKEDLDQRYAPFPKWLDEASVALTAAEGELTKASYDIDYAVVVDSANTVINNYSLADKAAADLQQKASELYQSYSLILQDQKAEYYIRIGRSSWNEAADGGESQYLYPNKILVPGDVYETLSTLPGDGTLATLSGNNVKMSNGLQKAVWDSLKINAKEKWTNSSHNSAEYWVEDWEIASFHKYIRIDGAERTETDWIAVDEDDFMELYDALGMTIAAKAYGEYESEKIEDPTPVGMEYVGNKEYGEWKKDDNGNDFWDFYLRYQMMNLMFGGSPYYRTEYVTYRDSYRGRGGYYGSDSANPRYGTRGSVTSKSSEFSNSSFQKGGGVSSTPASVRNAGAAARNRGPGSGK